MEQSYTETEETKTELFFFDEHIRFIKLFMNKHNEIDELMKKIQNVIKDKSIDIVDKFIEDNILGYSTFMNLSAADLKGVRMGLIEILKEFKEDHDDSIDMSTKIKFRLLIIIAAFTAYELQSIGLEYCPTDVLIDPFCSVVLKFPDEQVNISFDMDGKKAIYFIEGTSLSDSCVNEYVVNNPIELKTTLTILLKKTNCIE